jgi:hypothetical protein
MAIVPTQAVAVPLIKLRLEIGDLNFVLLLLIVLLLII